MEGHDGAPFNASVIPSALITAITLLNDNEHSSDNFKGLENYLLEHNSEVYLAFHFLKRLTFCSFVSAGTAVVNDLRNSSAFPAGDYLKDVNLEQFVIRNPFANSNALTIASSVAIMSDLPQWRDTYSTMIKLAQEVGPFNLRELKSLKVRLVNYESWLWLTAEHFVREHYDLVKLFHSAAGLKPVKISALLQKPDALSRAYTNRRSFLTWLSSTDQSLLNPSDRCLLTNRAYATVQCWFRVRDEFTRFKMLSKFSLEELRAFKAYLQAYLSDLILCETPLAFPIVFVNPDERYLQAEAMEFVRSSGTGKTQRMLLSLPFLHPPELKLLRDVLTFGICKKLKSRLKLMRTVINGIAECKVTYCKEMARDNAEKLKTGSDPVCFITAEQVNDDGGFRSCVETLRKGFGNAVDYVLYPMVNAAEYYTYASYPASFDVEQVAFLDTMRFFPFLLVDDRDYLKSQFQRDQRDLAFWYFKSVYFFKGVTDAYVNDPNLDAYFSMMKLNGEIGRTSIKYLPVGKRIRSDEFLDYYNVTSPALLLSALGSQNYMSKFVFLANFLPSFKGSRPRVISEASNPSTVPTRPLERTRRQESLDADLDSLLYLPDSHREQFQDVSLLLGDELSNELSFSRKRAREEQTSFRPTLVDDSVLSSSSCTRDKECNSHSRSKAKVDASNIAGDFLKDQSLVAEPLTTVLYEENLSSEDFIDQSLIAQPLNTLLYEENLDDYLMEAPSFASDTDFLDTPLTMLDHPNFSQPALEFLHHYQRSKRSIVETYGPASNSFASTELNFCLALNLFIMTAFVLKWLRLF